MATHFEKSKIINQYPWIQETGRKMVVGTDLDAMLSALLLSQYNNWDIIGFYDFTTIYYEKDQSIETLRQSVWVDLDVYRSEIASIGHHILTLEPNQVLNGHVNSLNPNLIRNTSYRNFSKKYPLGTIHFLAWLLGIDLPDDSNGKYLFWLPDSSWINAQSHRFRENVSEWLTECIPLPMLSRTFDEIDTKEYELGMKDFFQVLSENTGFQSIRGQVKSRHLEMSGMQCIMTIVDNKNIQRFSALANFVNKLYGWRIPRIPNDLTRINGRRCSTDTDFVNILNREDVFSYVFPYFKTINYTSFGGQI